MLRRLPRFFLLFLGSAVCACTSVVPSPTSGPAAEPDSAAALEQGPGVLVFDWADKQGHKIVFGWELQIGVADQIPPVRWQGTSAPPVEISMAAALAQAALAGANDLELVLSLQTSAGLEFRWSETMSAQGLQTEVARKIRMPEFFDLECVLDDPSRGGFSPGLSITAAMLKGETQPQLPQQEHGVLELVMPAAYAPVLEDGSAHFRGLMPGGYKLTLSVREREDLTQPDLVHALLPGQHRVTMKVERLAPQRASSVQLSADASSKIDWSDYQIERSPAFPRFARLSLSQRGVITALWQQDGQATSCFLRHKEEPALRSQVIQIRRAVHDAQVVVDFARD